MLYDTAEIEEAGGAHGEEAGEVWSRGMRSSPVQRIEQGVERIRIGRVEVSKLRKGRCPPGAADGPGAAINRLLLIGCVARHGHRVERRELEVGRRRPRGSRDR